MTGNIQSMTQHAGDVVGSQAWADGRTKTNVAPKNIHTLFFLIVGDVGYLVLPPQNEAHN